ncbi:YrbL family protein [Phytohalomonas tamaricis]|uniref:YrbL family protein n=1 Tax=Phytohalomonas tamaricis TaxID=2081032 RepID=UPI000D0BCB31|nr:YrbL family protein [Phytohalomonas tamaricis]
MLSLQGATLVGAGNDRRVYQHPDFPNRCIKIARYPERGSEQNTREKRYFSQLKQRDLSSWRHVPEYFGTVETDQGEGLVFSLILDANETISKTLRHYRQSSEIVLNQEMLVDQLDALYRYLYDNWVVPSDLNDRNIVCQYQENGHFHLWLIDGVSNPALLPLATVWPWFARRTINRRMRRFYTKLERSGLLDGHQYNRLRRALC